MGFFFDKCRFSCASICTLMLSNAKRCSGIFRTLHGLVQYPLGRCIVDEPLSRFGRLHKHFFTIYHISYHFVELSLVSKGAPVYDPILTIQLAKYLNRGKKKSYYIN